jgi:porin
MRHDRGPDFAGPACPPRRPPARHPGRSALVGLCLAAGAVPAAAQMAEPGAPDAAEPQLGAILHSGDALTEFPPPTPYDAPLLERRALTGDWFGVRTDMEDRGVTFDVYHTQYLGGVTSGGDDDGWDYGGRLDYLLAFGGQKLGLWPGFFVNVKAETRYGPDVNANTGSLSAPNFIVTFPRDDGEATALTNFTVTQALSERVAVYGGVLNTIDDYVVRFNPEVAGRPSLGGFQNTSLIWNPIVARTFPYATYGAGVAVLDDAFDPIVTVTVLDPEERAGGGFEDPFSEGAVIVPDVTLRGEFFGKPALLNFGGTYSTASYTSVSTSAFIDFPPELLAAGVFPEEDDSWSIYANAYQALYEDLPGRSFGLFAQVGLSDGNPNPVRWSISGGLAGWSPIPGRALDSFGIGGFYLGLSDDFKELSQFVLEQDDEYGFEAFYSVGLTPWARLTGDIQVISPSTQALDTAVVTGLRLQLRY